MFIAIISILVLTAIVYGIYFLGQYILNKHFEAIMLKFLNFLNDLDQEQGLKNENK